MQETARHGVALLGRTLVHAHFISLRARKLQEVCNRKHVKGTVGCCSVLGASIGNRLGSRHELVLDVGGGAERTVSTRALGEKIAG